MSPLLALIRLIFLAATVLIFTGGGLGLLLLWYRRGRDPRVGLYAEYLREPPDDLPPGAAGTLLDERADHQDVVATLLGLARNGAVSIGEIAGRKSGRPADYVLTLHDRALAGSQVERTLVDILFGLDATSGETVRLSAVKARFTGSEDVIRDRLYQELVTRGYFPRPPEETRRRWRLIAIAGIVLSIALGLVLEIALDWFGIFPMIAAVIMWAILLRMARHMPKKSRQGAEAAARWRAFANYLGNIRKYEQVEDVQHIFDHYLPYAVAFGIDKTWLRTFAAVRADRPRWYHTAPQTAGDVLILGGDFGGVPANGSVGELGGLGDLAGVAGRAAGEIASKAPGNVSMPDLSGVDLNSLSSDLGSGLQGASDGLSSLLDAAGSIFDGIDFDW